ncbi:MAG: hypothetical protein E6772_09315 [Dysgonomonas sp.]|nr:hypothetical protein [Dysgonomonas sp.]
MKKFINTLLFVFLISGTYFFTSCSSDSPALGGDDDVITSEMEEINSFSIDDLMKMKAELESQGIEVPEIGLTEEESESTTRFSWSKPTIKAIKVSTKTLHPNGSGNYINVSGVLLVPSKTWSTGLQTFRIIVSPPGTYTSNDAAPSIAYKSLIANNQVLSFMYFWILQAQSQVILIPDYPGFGDSYGQCFHPYLDSKALVNSTLDLIKASRSTLLANGYRYKKDISIAGYSQGAYVGASLAREIETNSHGFSVNLLVAGGTPCNLKYIADAVRSSDYLQHTYFLPYALWGYKENAYPNLNISDFLLEPYASKSKAYYDGTHADLNEYFSHVPSEVYTEKFIKYMDTDQSMTYINQILDENSVKPWKNNCRFIMTHGTGDVSVYFQNAKDFAASQNQAGGQVSFYSTNGDHLSAFAPFFTTATTYLALYR